MNTKTKLKNILAISLVVLLSACTHPNSDVPIQSNGDGYDSQYYQNPPIQQDNDGIDASDVALGVATGAVVGAVAKSAYDKRKIKQRQVAVVNKYYNGKPVSSYKKQSIRKPYSRSKRKW